MLPLDFSTAAASTAQGSPRTKTADRLHALKYRSPGESFEAAIDRVVEFLKDDARHRDRLIDIFGSQRFLPAGRIQTGAGSPKNTTLSNCYVSGPIADSFVDGAGSIMDRAKEAAATMRMGGGIGYDFSTLRPRGDMIQKLQSQASGPVSFMHIFDAVCLATASSGHRRGAQMAVLRVDHPSIEEFIAAKQDGHSLQGFNISVAITDEFMHAALLGRSFGLWWGGKFYRKVDAADLWDRIMRSTFDWAEPGVIFIDTINRMNNLRYAETISACNPCFTGDTKVWTATGPQTFAALTTRGEAVQVLTQRDDGRLVHREMKNIRLTQRHVKLVKVTLKGANRAPTIVKCTPNHNFYLTSGEKVEAVNLVAGMSIASVYRHRANSKGYLKLSNGNNLIMEHHVPFEDVVGLGKSFHVHHRDSDKSNNKPDNLELLISSDHNALNMWGGENPMRRFPERNHMLQEGLIGDRNGRYREDIADEALLELRNKGHSYKSISQLVGCSRYTVMKRLGWERPSLNHKVIAVEVLEEQEDVYCGTVEETGKFFLSLGEDDEGVLVSNCAEQPLPPFGACLLGSFNLPQYLTGYGPRSRTFDYQQLRQDTPAIVRALDNVIDRSLYPLPEQGSEAQSKRRLGIGVTGLANAVEAMGYPYGSRDFCAVERSILTTIRDECYQASADLAAEKGSFPLYDEGRYLAAPFIKTLPSELRAAIKRQGIRNSHLTSIAPTGTISLAADNVSSSIEPVFSYETHRPINTPEGRIVETLHDYGARFLGHRGKLAADVTADEHLDTLLTAQALVDSSVSKTINMDGTKMGWAEFKDIYRKVWESGGKGCATFNVSGKRGALLQAAQQGAGQKALAPPSEVDGPSCEIDPATGRRSCE